MKPSILSCVLVLAIAACAPQQPPPPPTAAAPTSYAVASPSNTTTFYDGTYEGNFVQQRSGANPNAQCPNYRVAPALTIRNGVARFAALDMDFHGYVTAQGELRAQAPTGQTFVGQIDPYYVLTGRVSGNCVYDATWKRRGGAGPSAN
jgi:hypothetical protein